MNLITRRLGKTTRGAAAVEYVTIIAGIAIALILSLTLFGGNLSKMFASAAAKLPNSSAGGAFDAASGTCSQAASSTNLVADPGPNESITPSGWGAYVWPSEVYPRIIITPSKYSYSDNYDSATLPWSFLFTPDEGATYTQWVPGAQPGDPQVEATFPVDEAVFVDSGNTGWLGPKDVSYNQVTTSTGGAGKLTISPMQTGVTVAGGCKYSVSVYSAEQLEWGDPPPAASSATGIAWYGANGNLISESAGKDLAFTTVSHEWGWSDGEGGYDGADSNEWTNEPTGTYTAPAGAVTGRPFVRYKMSGSEFFYTSSFDMHQV